MSLLPIFHTDSRDLSLLQTQWSSQINPVLNSPLNQGNILKAISIKTGVNTINHLLGKVEQGWIIMDIDAAVTLYRSKPFNDKTLTLVSSGASVVSLYVF